MLETTTGKNKCLANDQMITLGTLESIGSYLVDLHGQHEHQALLQARAQMNIVDDFGGLLALRKNAVHQAQVKKHGLEYIDLVVVNLYPFEKTLNTPKVTKEEIIENIDIGGPAMLRSAAKNYQDVVVVCDPQDYGMIIAELEDSQGEISLATKEKLAGKVFTHTAGYDLIISDYYMEDGSGGEIYQYLKNKSPVLFSYLCGKVRGFCF